MSLCTIYIWKVLFVYLTEWFCYLFGLVEKEVISIVFKPVFIYIRKELLCL